MTRERVYRRRLSILLGVSLFNWTAGNGLFPLLSLYALERGATVEITGMLLAAGFVSLAVGSMTAAWLTRIVGSQRWAYVGVALLQTCAYALMGQATEIWQLLALLACAWVGAGQAVAILQMMVGRAASAERRGRAFGLLALAPPLGSMIGASLLGAIAKQSGYQWAFGGGALLVLAAALLMTVGMPREDAHAPQTIARSQPTRPTARWSLVEIGLLLSALLAATAQAFGNLVTPVMMNALSFDPQAIAATTAIGGLVTAPLVPLMSELSDRLGRRPVLVGTYGLIAVALGVLAFADQYWQFSLAAALLSLGFAVGTSVSAALAGDLIAAAALPHTLGRLSTATWIGAVLAFGGGGALLGSIAVPTLCLLALLLAVSASLTASFLRTTPAVSMEFPLHTGVSHGPAD